MKKKKLLTRKRNIETLNIKNLVRDINKSTTAQVKNFLNRYTENELFTLRDKIAIDNNLTALKTVVSSINRRLGYTGTELRKRNKSDIEIVLSNTEYARNVNEVTSASNIRKIANRMKKIEKQLNIKPSIGRTFTIDNVPSSVVISKGLDAFIDNALFTNNLKPIATNKVKSENLHKYRQKSDVVKELAKKEFYEILKDAEKLNKYKVQQEITSQTIDFMENKFFKEGNERLQSVINEYINYLPVPKRLEIQDLLVSSEFLQQWDSDEDAENYDSNLSSNARAVKRQNLLIDILRNETGMVIDADLNNRITERTKIKNHKKKGDLLMSKYI